MRDSFRKNSWPRAAVRIGGSLFILTLLFCFLPIGDLWSAVRRVSFAVWLLALAGYIGAHTIALIKWRLTANLAGSGLSFAGAARCHFAGQFGNLFLPSIMGGEVIRVGLGLSLARNKSALLLGSLLDRVLDIAALASVMAFGAFLLPGALDAQSRRVFWIVTGSVFLLILVSLALLVALPFQRFSLKIRRRIENVLEALRSVARRPSLLLLSLSLGIATQTSLVMLTAWIGEACGLNLRLSVWLFAWPLAKLAALLPLTQGGIGVREIALGGLLAPFGAPVVLTVAVGLVWETILIAGSLLAGLLSLAASRFSAARPEQVQEAPSAEEKACAMPHS